ncbi:hypothetical protein ACE6ZO_004620 [Salmonella enterica]|nr:hypothetical protein [Salmonella enterica]EHC5973205.1 hypothetical protein [Salmonella enterica]EIU9581676.1 hypothetical protein [Salmonella enterica]ELC1719903.1 hypothetical protein [Salmonella enterica]
MNNNSVCLITGTLVSFLLFAGEGRAAWVPGGTGGNVDMGGSITPSGPKNPWEVEVGDAVTGLDMVLPESGTVVRHRLKQTLPVLGIRTTTGLTETFGGETAGGIAPQITFSGVLPGAREKGRLPLELEVTRAEDNSHVLGMLRLNLLTGAEVSQNNPVTNEGRRYSVWASQQGEAFYGGTARTPDEAVDDALAQVGDIFPVYRARYNDQGLLPPRGAKQSVEFRNAAMRYSGFYAAGLVQGDELILRAENELPSSGVAWKASLNVAVEYR